MTFRFLKTEIKILNNIFKEKKVLARYINVTHIYRKELWLIIERFIFKLKNLIKLILSHKYI